MKNPTLSAKRCEKQISKVSYFFLAVLKTPNFIGTLTEL